MTAKNAKFAITTQSGRSIVKEFTSYAEAQKYADRHFGKGSIVQMVGNSRAANAKFEVGDIVVDKGFPSIKLRIVQDDSRYNPNEHTYAVKPLRGGAVTTSREEDLKLANSVACNSTNPVVRKAVNAVALNLKLIPFVKAKVEPGDSVWYRGREYEYIGSVGSTRVEIEDIFEGERDVVSVYDKDLKMAANATASRENV